MTMNLNTEINKDYNSNFTLQSMMTMPPQDIHR